MITQRIIVPGGRDLLTSPPISRTQFERMSPSRDIPLLPHGLVMRAECTWDTRHDTIRLLPEVVQALQLVD